MTRFVGQEIETKVQVIDANSDPATGATVSWKLYDQNGELWDDGTMTHIGDGIFSFSWTPNAAGEWTAECFSSNPKFRKSFTYYVETPLVWERQPRSYLLLSPPVFNQWETLVDMSGALKLYSLIFWQSNDESNNKNMEIRITLDGGSPTTVTRTLPNNVVNSVFSVSGESFEVDTTGEALLGFYLYSGVAPEPKTFPLEAKSILIEVRMTSGNGTSQQLGIDLVYDKKGEVIFD
jgi:hypothetical protein